MWSEEGEIHRVLPGHEPGPGPELQCEEVHPSKGQAVRQDQTCLGTVKGSSRAGKGGQQVGADV